MTTDILADQLAAVRGELTRVDAKSSTLAGLTGAGLAFTVSVTAGHGHGLVVWLTGVAGLLLAAAALVLLAVLRPRLGGGGFRKYAAMSTDEITDELRANPAGGCRLRAEDLRVLSAIVNHKYKALRIAVALIMTAVTVLAAATLAGVAS